MGIYDVPAGLLIQEAAKDLKEKIKKPGFADYVKTGAHRERAPDNPDWFYNRAASILYRVYKEGNLGTGALRTYYGGRKKRGVKPEEKRKASGKIIRTCLQLLEKEGLVKKDKKGRKITPKGEKFLYQKSIEAGKAFSEVRRKKEEQEKIDAEKREEQRQKALQQKQAEERQKAEKKAAEQSKANAAEKKGTDGGAEAQAKELRGQLKQEEKSHAQHGHAKAAEAKSGQGTGHKPKEHAHEAGYAHEKAKEKKEHKTAGN